ncbi:GMC oxidoreductase [Granulicoccus phenolivorans]|uniref:GMC oxidoreductase n=1 Tax=Granulicoccus phenolivorans TaxID=266854 RepID=UPI00041C3D9B|nr:GMC oxidoreductase [Granulicoccus phenolivorans]
MAPTADVLVVGAGSAGCVLAHRLAAEGRRVRLVEAGGRGVPRRADRLPLTPPWARSYPAELGTGGQVRIWRGATLGGSGAVNGCYLLPPTDAAGWPWPDPVLAAAVDRVWARFDPEVAPDPDIRAWLASCGVPPTPVPLSMHAGQRISAADAYPLTRVALHTDTSVTHLLRQADRVTGVALADGSEWRAGEVALAAGTIGTLSLLARSGLITEAVGLVEHPELLFDSPAPAGAPDPAAVPGPLLATVAHREVPHPGLGTACLEVRPYARPFGAVIPGAGGPPTPQLGLALMGTTSRGRLHLDPAGAAVIDLGLLTDPGDRRALAAATEWARDVLGVRGPGVPATSQHLSGGAELGVRCDPSGRWSGVRGLRIVDGAALPGQRRRGPHAAILALADELARRWDQ